MMELSFRMTDFKFGNFQVRLDAKQLCFELV